MGLFTIIVRWFFSILFVLGGIAHAVLGRVHPEGYAPFGKTAVVPALSRFWEGFVMPHIGWLTLLLAVVEIAIGIGLFIGGRATRLAALAALGFFTFLLVLGTGYPDLTGWEDFAKNHLAHIVMILLMAPVVLLPQAPLRSGHKSPRRGLPTS